jgi:hypothetical protein
LIIRLAVMLIFSLTASLITTIHHKVFRLISLKKLSGTKIRFRQI